jgi:hypothetical protein
MIVVDVEWVLLHAGVTTHNAAANTRSLKAFDTDGPLKML